MLLHNKLILGLVILFYTFNSEARPLNVLFVVEYFPAPSQIFILNIITGLIDNGHNVSIFSFCKNSSCKKISAAQHPDIEKYRLLDSVIYESWPAALPDCDIVFCQSGSLGKKIFDNDDLVEWLKNRKIVVALRGNDITGNHIKEDPDIYKKLLEKADLFLPVCDYFKKVLIALGCDEEKIAVHHSAIKSGQFFFKKRKKPENGPINLVSVCRLVEKKGLEYALEAVAKIVKKYPRIHFTIVGKGRLQASLEQLIKKLKIGDYVTLFGWGTHEQVVTILDNSHIFLLPSITALNGDEEGIANALKEAMAMGLISIGTWHAGTPELIEDGVSGFMVSQKDSCQLSAAIEYIIEHPDIWEPIGMAARKKVEEEFEVKQSIKKLEQLFYTLLMQ
jgi:colanic acid/amylovoran biosynthesis glycosyltransferase